MRDGFSSTTDPMLNARNPNLKTNPYLPGSRTISIKNPYALAAPPNSGIVRPKIARGRADCSLHKTSLDSKSSPYTSSKTNGKGQILRLKG